MSSIPGVVPGADASIIAGMDGTAPLPLSSSFLSSPPPLPPKHRASSVPGAVPGADASIIAAMDGADVEAENALVRSLGPTGDGYAIVARDLQKARGVF